MRWWLAVACVAGCSFDVNGAANTTAPPADANVDATVDAHFDAPIDADPCPTGYAPILGGEANSQYKHVAKGVKWLDAEQACEADGLAHLVVLDSDAERDAVRALDGANLWVGLSDRVSEGTFLRVTNGTATYLPWLFGEPNDSGGNEDCVELKISGFSDGFNDNNCQTSDAYVCECDGEPANPIAYTPPP